MTIEKGSELTGINPHSLPQKWRFSEETLFSEYVGITMELFFFF